MDFLQANWFQILTLAIFVGGWLISKGKRDEQMKQLIDAVKKIDEKQDETETDLAAHVQTFNTHVADPDLHVNRNLRELLDNRFRELHSSVGMIQKTLDKM
jgi:hypothetical protein